MDASALIDAYCAVWTEPDPSRRAALLQSVWAPGATYTDPTVRAAGADELLARIASVQEKRPGAQVVRTSAVSLHHHIARFAWHVVEHGTTLPEGLDIAFLADDGSRIERIVGFFGTPEVRSDWHAWFGRRGCSTCPRP